MIDNPSAFLIKISDGAELPTFSTIAGMNQVQHDDDIIEGVGMFTSAMAHDMLVDTAVAGTVSEYELSFSDGAQWRGLCTVMHVEPLGERNGEAAYRVVMAKFAA